MLVVAEGIEEAEQLEFLRQAGCDEGQGYFISKPLPKEAFINFIESYEAVPQCKVAVDKG
jgi:EAL domain-containing protein (putative c-di-GMP-specific phosphodiesterase class I)